MVSLRCSSLFSPACAGVFSYWGYQMNTIKQKRFYSPPDFSPRFQKPPR
jgi:hypothetical protein